MDFSFSHVDFDCTLTNPLMAGTIVLAAAVVAPGLVLLASRLGVSSGRRFIAAIGLVLLGWVLEAVLTWILFRLGAWTAQIGCISSSPFWMVLLLQAVSSGVFGVPVWWRERRARKRPG